jgi:hypothetical protein
MIGDLIEKFEGLPSNTVKDFNNVFPHSPINYPDHYEVEIKAISHGLREILINDELILHDINHRGSERFVKPNKFGKGKSVSMRLYHTDKSFIGDFKSSHDAARGIDVTYATLRKYIRDGKIIREL